MNNKVPDTSAIYRKLKVIAPYSTEFTSYHVEGGYYDRAYTDYCVGCVWCVFEEMGYYG